MKFEFKGKHSFQYVKNSYFQFCKVVWQRNLGEVGKILSYFVAYLSKTLHIIFYQNWSSIVEAIIKNFGVIFYAP